MHLFEIEKEIKGLIENSRATETKIEKFNILVKMLSQYDITAINRKYLFQLFEIKDFKDYKKIKNRISIFLKKSSLNPVGNNVYIVKNRDKKIYLGTDEGKALFLRHYCNISNSNLFFYLATF
ncbi:MAG: hypothetical protein AABY22_15565 [Nanoarchaeota archaeon]